MYPSRILRKWPWTPQFSIERSEVDSIRPANCPHRSRKFSNCSCAFDILCRSSEIEHLSLKEEAAKSSSIDHIRGVSRPEQFAICRYICPGDHDEPQMSSNLVYPSVFSAPRRRVIIWTGFVVKRNPGVCGTLRQACQRADVISISPAANLGQHFQMAAEEYCDGFA